MEFLLAQVDEAAPGLNAGGWTMMVLCIGLVCGLCVYCFYKMFSEPAPSEHFHAPLDIDTRDDE
jgi:hypothetical protein